LLINFGALAIGGLAAREGVDSDWYYNLNKAPWTPPGWVFGFTWSFIMICLSIYMAMAYECVQKNKPLLIIFGIQWILNVIWNPMFFHFHSTVTGLIIISSLTLIVCLIAYQYRNEMKKFTLLLAPYILWLFIATSLNAYIVLNN